MRQTALASAAIIALILSTFAFFNVFSGWNSTLTDTLYTKEEPFNNFLIVAIDDKSIQEIGRWPWNREVYAPFLVNLDQAKLIAFDIAFFEPTPQDRVLAGAMKDFGNTILAIEYDFERNLTLGPGTLFLNITPGYINVHTDPDGIVRRVSSVLEGNDTFPTAIAKKIAPVEPPEQFLVSFAKPFERISFSDALKEEPEKFKDKIVFVGATAPNLHDDYLVPISDGKRMPGVEFHANAVQTILTKKYLAEEPKWMVILTILALCFALGTLFSFARMRVAIITGAILLFAYFGLAIYTSFKGYFLDLIYPPLSLILTTISCTAIIAAEESKHKKHILGLFGRYVSKDVVKHLTETKGAVELGGEERIITAMFADIRGFTTISEKMSPHQVISFLNHYFGDMTDLVFKHNGTLDKFIGDALFAIWGSPLPQQDHALNAVKCAIEIQQRLRTKRRFGMPKIKLGIGICTGPAVIGNMGSKQRQEFTAIGDTVNTASRLSGLTEGGQIIITESTYNAVKEQVIARKLSSIKVKGKEKPVAVYEVLRLKKSAN
jgi:adenylate cyclase